MKCIIPGTNIKVFGRAIHSLSKIGEELYIEPLDHGLALRTVNSSRSAYACFLFTPSFFQHYDDGSGEVDSQDSDDTLRCKIAMKSILTVFKSLSSMEKTVERCKIRHNVKDSRLVFQLHCRHGIVKTHNLAFIECETLQAVFSKDMCPNSLTASSKLLCDAVLNFQNTQEEVTLIVNPEKICLKNYVEDEPDPNKVMHTNLSLEPDEFDNCQIGVDTEVTFCLKELRAILAFSEVTTLPLTLNFETAGRPIVFTIDSDSTFEGNFVLATLADQQSQVPHTQARSTTQKRQPSKKSSRGSNSRVNRPTQNSWSRPSNNGDHSHNVTGDTRAGEDLQRSQRLESAYDELMNDDTDFDELIIQNDTTIAQLPPQQTHTDTRDTSGTCGTGNKNKASENRANENRASEKDNGADSERIESSRASEQGVNSVGAKGDNGMRIGYIDSVRKRAASPQAGCSKTSDESPVIPIIGTKVKIGDTTLTEDDAIMSDEEDELVPGTPPAKRFRSLFFGSSQVSQSQSARPDVMSTSRVLAEDTDEED